jgi:hypothetical protein
MFAGCLRILPCIRTSCCHSKKLLFLSPLCVSWLLSTDFFFFHSRLSGTYFKPVNIFLATSAVLFVTHSVPIPFIHNPCFVKHSIFELILITSVWLNIFIIFCRFLLNICTYLFTYDEASKSNLQGALITKSVFLWFVQSVSYIQAL